LSESTTWLPQPAQTAGFGVRVLAYLVDGIILSIFGGAFPYLVIPNETSVAVGQQVTTTASGSVLVSLIYFVIFWSSLGGGRTLGMRLLKLRVVREDSMAPPGVIDAFVRWIGLWVSFVLCFVGVIWVAFDSRHQGWHDKLAKTLVLHT
jgi:uncharacterized RDD family membrane protein YckC